MSLSRKHAPAFSTVVSVIAASLSLLVLDACNSSAPHERVPSVIPRAVDILVMVDDSSSMTSMQQKMLAEIPAFIQSLQAIPGGLPDVHIAVVSSDMGAPSNISLMGCSQTGDEGKFFPQPQGTCVATTLLPGATFIADDASGATKNFTLADPDGLATVLQCVALLGESGCGFEHQLASVARALGADGSPAPAGNAGFLRSGAELAIVMLTNEDDCSARASASPLPIYSFTGDIQSIQNPDGPLANYRCNGGPLGGHLCNDPTASNPNVFTQPPLNPPADVVGDPPTLNLTNCESNDTGSSGLLPVSSLVAEIKALKSNPGPDIVVGAIMAPTTPYVVDWLPSTGSPTNELWPSVAHSCSSASDGSFGDPPVRIAQFVKAFGDNGVTGSICDDSYQAAFELIASKIASHLPGASTGTGGPDGGPDGGSDGGSDGGPDGGVSKP